MSQPTSGKGSTKKEGMLSVLMLENRPRLRTLALGCTIAAAFYLLWHSDEQTQSADDAAELQGSDEPDGFVKNGIYTAYDKIGNIQIRFQSPRIEQFEESGLAVITHPHAEVHGKPGTLPWIVDADTGRLQQGNDLLHLEDHVRIERKVNDQLSVLTTTHLTLDNNAGTVYTDAPVKITDRIGVTHATGMKAWIDKRILELNSKVEGRYETGQ